MVFRWVLLLMTGFFIYNCALEPGLSGRDIIGHYKGAVDEPTEEDLIKDLDLEDSSLKQNEDKESLNDSDEDNSTITTENDSEETGSDNSNSNRGDANDIAAPSDLRIEINEFDPGEGCLITLFWTDESNNEVLFEIERKYQESSGIAWLDKVELIEIRSDSSTELGIELSYFDSIDLFNKKNTTYRVRAVAEDNTSSMYSSGVAVPSSCF